MKEEKGGSGRRIESEVPRLVAVDAGGPRVFRLTARRVAVGSAADSNLRLSIAEGTVSEHHARIRRRFGRYALKDLRSAHGTFVNGRRIKGWTPIQPGDEIRFGSIRFAVVRGPAERAGIAGGRITTAVALVAACAVIGYLGTRFVQTWEEIGVPGGATAARPRPSATPAAARAEPTRASPSTPVSSRASRHVAVRPHSEGTPSEAATSANRAVKHPAVHADAETPSPRTSPSGLPPGPWDNWPKPGDWLGWVNWYRTEAGLKPVTEDPKLSKGDLKHAMYIVKNYLAAPRPRLAPGIEMHQERSGNPWYTPEGAKAGLSSDVAEWPTCRPGYLPALAVNGWIDGAFHRLLILNPFLGHAGYGQYAEGRGCAAALNVETGAAVQRVGSGLSKPVEFPAPDATTYLNSLGREWPDPLGACPGYKRPVGLPITIQLGSFIKTKLTKYSLRLGRAPVEACGFDTGSYLNADPVTQRHGREVLYGLGAVVIVPRKPLAPGETYRVSATVNAHEYAWSFRVGKVPASVVEKMAGR